MDVSRIDDTVEHTAFNPIQYVPLQKKSFDRIDILLATDYGEPLPFVPDSCVGVSSDGASTVSYTHLTLPTILRV